MRKESGKMNINNYLDSQTSDLKVRKVLSFNSDWRFTTKLVEPSNNDIDYSFEQVCLPHDYSIEADFKNTYQSGPSGGYVRTGVIWYKKVFKIDEEQRNKKIYILFDGISAKSEVWINGMQVAMHPYAYTPVWIDATSHLRYGNEDNIILVKADTLLQPYSRFYQGTGIYRNVELIIVDPLHIDQWGISTNTVSANTDLAEVEVKTSIRANKFKETVWNDFGAAPNTLVEKNCILQTIIMDEEDKIVAEENTSFLIYNYDDKQLSQNLKIEKPNLWSDEASHLYQIHSMIILDGEIVDDCITPLGVRTISYDSKNGFLLNGKMVKIKGVCLHQDDGIFGCAVPVKAWIRKVKLLKEMGCNGIRCSHHPFPKEFYHICDYLGMLVMDEAFDEWKKGWSRCQSETPWGKNAYGYYQYFEQWAETDVKLMVQRSKNHPCVIMWSLGNEIPDYNYEEGVETLKRLYNVCKKCDPTRSITIAGEGQYRLNYAKGIMENVDIAGYNYVNIKNKDYYDTLSRENPERIFLSTETFLNMDEWQAVLRTDAAIGQFIWGGTDYLGESHYNNPSNDMTLDLSQSKSVSNQNFGGIGLGNEERKMEIESKYNSFLHGWHSGIIDIIGGKKGQYFYNQSLWSTKPVIHIGVKNGEWEREGCWKLIPAIDSWNNKDGETKRLYCFTNCEKVDIILNNKLIKTLVKDNNNILPIEFDVEFESGVITAVGYIKNEKACKHSLNTASKAASIDVNVDSYELLANGNDYSFLDMTIIDENSNCVFFDNREITLTVESGVDCCEVFRLGNGSLKNEKTYNTNSFMTFNGRCLGVIRSKNIAGEAIIRVSVDGLNDKLIKLKVI